VAKIYKNVLFLETELRLPVYLSIFDLSIKRSKTYFAKLLFERILDA